MPSARYGALFLVEPLVWLTPRLVGYTEADAPRNRWLVLGTAMEPIRAEPQPSVMQPWLASSTFLMYFQSAPLLALRGGAVHSF